MHFLFAQFYLPAQKVCLLITLSYWSKWVFKIEAFLPQEYRNEPILNNKLYNAVKDVEKCQVACHKTASTVQTITSDRCALLALTKIQSSASAQFEHSANFGGLLLICKNYPRSAIIESSKNCFKYEGQICWIKNHSLIEKLYLFLKNKCFGQSMVFLKTKWSLDGRERRCERYSYCSHSSYPDQRCCRQVRWMQQSYRPKIRLFVHDDSRW